MNKHFDAPGGMFGQVAGGKIPRDERRRSRRHRVLYRAMVVFGESTLSCTVKDMSQHGCKLRFAVPPTLPEFFELRLQRPIRRLKCQLVWVSASEAGVRFVQ